MMRDSGWAYAVPVARTLAGFILALLMAFIGDLSARIFSLTVGYPWSFEVHSHLNYVGIGMGAGLGAYLGWVNLNHRWYQMAGIALLVMAGGVLGVYVGRVYSPGVDPTYWWSRFATDTRLYLSAGISAIVFATAIGLADQIITSVRLKSRYQRVVAQRQSLEVSTSE